MHKHTLPCAADRHLLAYVTLRSLISQHTFRVRHEQGRVWGAHARTGEKHVSHLDTSQGRTRFPGTAPPPPLPLPWDSGDTKGSPCPRHSVCLHVVANPISTLAQRVAALRLSPWNITEFDIPKLNQPLVPLAHQTTETPRPARSISESRFSSRMEKNSKFLLKVQFYQYRADF